MDGDSKGRETQIHPKIEPVSYLLGRWRGEGEVCIRPSIHLNMGRSLPSRIPREAGDIIHTENMEAQHRRPMHAESGYWRPKLDGTIEFVIAQSTGLLELQKGTYNSEDKVIRLHSELVGNASKVKEISRVFQLVNEELHYVVEMGTNTTSVQPHLKAVLKKV